MAENFFSQTLRHHLAQTRAGLFGQFEHAWNRRPGGDPRYDLLPTQSILFEGETTEEQACSLLLENNLSGDSGEGFNAKLDLPPGREILIPLRKGGDARLEFSCPTSDPGIRGIQSYAVQGVRFAGTDRFEAIDSADTVIFRKTNIGRSWDIVRDSSGGWHVSGDRIPFSDGLGDGASFDGGGTFVGRYFKDFWGGTSTKVAYDSVNDRVVLLLNNFLVGPSVFGYDASGGDQGGPSEPAELWETLVSASSPSGSSMDMVAGNNGFVYVSIDRNDAYDGATPGTLKSLLKIDTLTGTVVAAYDLGTTDRPFLASLAVDSSGNILVISSHTASVDYEDFATFGSANVYKFDANLNLLGATFADFDTDAGAGLGIRNTKVTSDATDRVFVAGSSNGGATWCMRFDSGLTTKEFSKSLGSDHFIQCLGHDHASQLYTFGRDTVLARALIVRYDDDGNETSRFLPAAPALDIRSQGCYVDQGIPGAGPGPDVGSIFTQEQSVNPPGRLQAYGSVKYDSQRLVSAFWNSVGAEFDVSKWKATHSVEGVIPIGEWEYNSPL